MRLYKLNKTVLSIQNNAVQFLNGLTANTLDKPHNVFLNIHGRIIATFEQIKIGEDEFWIILESPFVDRLVQHLGRYAQLSKVRIEELDKYVYFDLEGKPASSPEGERAIPHKKGRLIISSHEMEAAVSEQEFVLFRLRNKIPIQGIDYTDEFVLNVGDEGLVSFTKGCFLGQEPVAKVHNCSRSTWQLVVKYENKCDEKTQAKMTSKVLDPDTNRMIGFTFTPNE